MADSSKKHSCRVYLSFFAEEKLEQIKRLVLQITRDCTVKNNSLIVCMNDNYEVDVNAMARKCIKPFLGQESTLKRIQSEFSAEIWLVVVPEIIADSDEPKQILSLDKDVIEFLYKSGVKYDLDYYIV